MPKKAKLSKKQALFVEYYTSNPETSGTEAAIKAGYSKKTARFQAAENLTKPHIKKAVEEVQAKTSQEIKLTKADLIADTLAIRQRCQVREDDKTSLKANELLGKMIGAFNDNVGGVTNIFNFAHKDEENL